MVLALEQWGKILGKVKIDNSNDVFEQIKEELKKQDENTYREWEQRAFDEKHIFNVFGEVFFSSNVELTLLSIATSIGHKDIVKYLVEQKAHPDIGISMSSCDPLNIAIFCDQKDIVEYLIEKREIDVNQKNGDGNTLLHIAINSGGSRSKKVIKFLFEKDVNLNILNDQEESSLMLAMAKKDIDIINTIIAKGADVNMKSKGWAPLRKAISYDDTELVRILIDAGASVNGKVDSGCTVLNFAVGYSRARITSTECSKILIKHIILRKPEVIKPEYVTDYHELSEFWDSCQNEFRTEVVDGITLRDILTSKRSRLVSYVRNKDVQEILESGDYQSRFPIYGSALKSQYEKGMEEISLSAKLTEVNFLEKTSKEIINGSERKLPLEVCEEIVSRMDNVSVKNLSEAVGLRK